MIPVLAGIAAAIGFAFAAGFAIVGARAVAGRGLRAAILNGSLWFLAGTGVTSLTFPAWRLLLHQRGGVSYLTFDAVAVLVLWGVARVLRSRRVRELAPEVVGRAATRAEIALMVATVTAALLASVAFAVTSAAAPHGDWDAFAIWNARARTMLLAPDAWQAFDPRPGHPDYPLLLPGSVARVWSYAGRDTPLAPAILAYLFAAAGAGVLGAGLAVLRARAIGIVGGLLLLGTWDWIREAPHQYADVPLASYLVAGFVMLAAVDRDVGAGRNVILAGLFLGLAAWTKNEGSLLALCAVSAWVAARWHRFRGSAVLPLLVGAAVPIAVLVAFKASVPANYMVARRSFEEIAAHATSALRYLAIARSFLLETITFGKGAPPFAMSVLFLAGMTLRDLYRSWRSWALVAMLGGYFAAYLLTPLPLEEQLDSSLARLLLHLWPAALFTMLHDATPAYLLGSSEGTRELDRRRTDRSGACTC